MQVIKRDGRKVNFDINKISEAVRKAYTEVYPNVNVYIDSIIADISGRIDDLGFSEITIEQIQDIVEKELMNDDKDVAKAYITYRYRRAMARDEYKALMADVKEKLSAENVQNQSANVNRKKHPDGGHYRDYFYYACKHRIFVNGHKCTYRKQWNEDKINAAVEEVIRKLVNNPKFKTEIQKHISQSIDTQELDREHTGLQERLKQVTGAKNKLANQMDNLSVSDKHYDKKYEDMQVSLDKLNRNFD